MKNSIRNLLIISILASSTIACSWKDVVDLFTGSSGGVNTEIVVGDKKEEISTEIGTQKQTADKITNTTVNEAPIGLIIGFTLFGVLGWVLPTPQSMWKSWRESRG